MEMRLKKDKEAVVPGPIPEFCDEAVNAAVATEFATYSMFAGSATVHLHHL